MDEHINAENDIALLCRKFDGLLAGNTLLNPEARAELTALAHIFDLDVPREPADLWPVLRAVLIRQMPANNDQERSMTMSPRTILLVEDDADTAAALTEALDAAGHRVVGPFHSAEAAEAATALHSIDLALLDINLSGRTTGIDLARSLKNRWGTPVIFISGDVSQAARHAELAFAMLIKPYSSQDVLSAIARVDTAA